MIDILVPTYNGEKYLGGQLDSLLAQTMGRLVFLDRPTVLFRRHARNESVVRKYGPLSYFKKRNLVGQSRERLRAIFGNHAIFFRTFGPRMGPAQHRFFETVAGLPSRPWIMRRYLILKHRLFKTGFLKNVGMLLII